jgi:hypothetical protein
MAKINITRENQRKLKKLGLSPDIFDADKFQRDVAIYHAMCERIKLLEESDEWKDKDLPWREEREQYKRDEAAGLIAPYEPGVEIMRPPFAQPKIVRAMNDWTVAFRNGFPSAGARTLALYHRKKDAMKVAEEQVSEVKVETR